MPYIPLEKLIDKTDNSLYKLVVLASKRAFEIAEGAPPLVEKTSSSKPGSIALEEIAQGKVRIKQAKTKKT
ncbi:MAG: DNA-directed RNA polymerase subunit omega [Candidatus Omnitrophica bacterium]|nr:DNA-directed RNA polymerase subunit omega [Candidatus Omnitrophota bacterium]